MRQKKDKKRRIESIWQVQWFDVADALQTFGVSLEVGETYNFGCSRFQLHRSFHDSQPCIVDTGDADTLYPINRETLLTVGCYRQNGKLYAIA